MPKQTWTSPIVVNIKEIKQDVSPLAKRGIIEIELANPKLQQGKVPDTIHWVRHSV